MPNSFTRTIVAPGEQVSKDPSQATVTTAGGAFSVTVEGVETAYAANAGFTVAAGVRSFLVETATSVTITVTQEAYEIPTGGSEGGVTESQVKAITDPIAARVTELETPRVYYPARYFGVVPDPTTDQTAAFATAFSDLQALVPTGATLRLETGVYRANVVIPDSNFGIEGAGVSQTILQAPDGLGTDPVITTEGYAANVGTTNLGIGNIYIDGLTVHGNAYTDTDPPVSIANGARGDGIRVHCYGSLIGGSKGLSIVCCSLNGLVVTWGGSLESGMSNDILIYEIKHIGLDGAVILGSHDSNVAISEVTDVGRSNHLTEQGGASYVAIGARLLPSTHAHFGTDGLLKGVAHGGSGYQTGYMVYVTDATGATGDDQGAAGLLIVDADGVPTAPYVAWIRGVNAAGSPLSPLTKKATTVTLRIVPPIGVTEPTGLNRCILTAAVSGGGTIGTVTASQVGTGYRQWPMITATGGGGSGYSAVGFVGEKTGGSIMRVVPVAAGTGYDYSVSLTVSQAGFAGTAAYLVPEISSGAINTTWAGAPGWQLLWPETGGVKDTISIANGGTAGTARPTINSRGEVVSWTVVSAGSGNTPGKKTIDRFAGILPAAAVAGGHAGGSAIRKVHGYGAQFYGLRTTAPIDVMDTTMEGMAIPYCIQVNNNRRVNNNICYSSTANYDGFFSVGYCFGGLHDSLMGEACKMAVSGNIASGMRIGAWDNGNSVGGIVGDIALTPRESIATWATTNYTSSLFGVTVIRTNYGNSDTLKVKGASVRSTETVTFRTPAMNPAVLGYIGNETTPYYQFNGYGSNAWIWWEGMVHKFTIAKGDTSTNGVEIDGPNGRLYTRRMNTSGIAALTAATTLTTSNIAPTILATGSGGWNLTLPSPSAFGSDIAWSFVLINDTSGTITLVAGSGTITGSTSVATGTRAVIRSAGKTVIYRD